MTVRGTYSGSGVLVAILASSVGLALCSVASQAFATIVISSAFARSDVADNHEPHPGRYDSDTKTNESGATATASLPEDGPQGAFLSTTKLDYSTLADSATFTTTVQQTWGGVLGVYGTLSYSQGKSKIDFTPTSNVAYLATASDYSVTGNPNSIADFYATIEDLTTNTFPLVFQLKTGQPPYLVGDIGGVLFGGHNYELVLNAYISARLDLIDGSSYPATAAGFASLALSPISVPEPSSIVVVGIGGLVLSACCVRRRP